MRRSLLLPLGQTQSATASKMLFSLMITFSRLFCALSSMVVLLRAELVNFRSARAPCLEPAMTSDSAQFDDAELDTSSVAPVGYAAPLQPTTAYIHDSPPPPPPAGADSAGPADGVWDDMAYEGEDEEIWDESEEEEEEMMRLGEVDDADWGGEEKGACPPTPALVSHCQG